LIFILIKALQWYKLHIKNIIITFNKVQLFFHMTPYIGDLNINQIWPERPRRKESDWVCQHVLDAVKQSMGKVRPLWVQKKNCRSLHLTYQNALDSASDTKKQWNRTNKSSSINTYRPISDSHLHLSCSIIYF